MVMTHNSFISYTLIPHGHFKGTTSITIKGDFNLRNAMWLLRNAWDVKLSKYIFPALLTPRLYKLKLSSE